MGLPLIRIACFRVCRDRAVVRTLIGSREPTRRTHAGSLPRIVHAAPPEISAFELFQHVGKIIVRFIFADRLRFFRFVLFEEIFRYLFEKARRRTLGRRLHAPALLARRNQ